MGQTQKQTVTEFMLANIGGNTLKGMKAKMPPEDDSVDIDENQPLLEKLAGLISNMGKSMDNLGAEMRQRKTPDVDDRLLHLYCGQLEMARTNNRNQLFLGISIIGVMLLSTGFLYMQTKARPAMQGNGEVLAALGENNAAIMGANQTLGKLDKNSAAVAEALALLTKAVKTNGAATNGNLDKRFDALAKKINKLNKRKIMPHRRKQ